MLEIRFFGLPQVFVNGTPRQGARSRPAEWLLALLALRAGEPVTRSWLAGTLWPESSEPQAMLNLRLTLMRLRDLLDLEVDRIAIPKRGTLRLDLKGAVVDVTEFDACVARGDDASLQRAVALYAGPLLEGCDRAWILPERKRRAQQCVATLEQLATGALSRGAIEESLNTWHRAVAMDWTRDSAQRGLMRALDASGDGPAALLTYRDYRLRLREELGLEPDPETVALYTQIRERVRQPAAESSGERRMPPLPASAPPSLHSDHPLPGPSAGKTSIRPLESLVPTPLTAIIGREVEVAVVVASVRLNRLVTLVGAGGIGKTRLSIQVAKELLTEFTDGITYVELAALTDGLQITSHIAASLGIEEAPDESSLPAALAGRMALLVLDNCEHLLSSVAPLVHDLVERCPRLHILATSRERLGVTGEQLWRVPPLAVPESPVNIDHVLSAQAVRLFIERAEAAQSGFQLADREDIQAVWTLCKRLDGIPLAIELAAGRIGPLSLQQIADRLDDRFQLLTRGSRAALPRHRTLKALIDWSYDLLSAEEQKLLQRLSLFVGGWTLEAAEAVCSADGGVGRSEGSTLAVRKALDANQVEDNGLGSGPNAQRLTPNAHAVLDLLTSLADRSLVMAETRGRLTRCRMLETIREYALEALRAAGEEEEVRRLYLACMVELAESACQELVRSQSDAAVERIKTELDNMRAVLSWVNREDSEPNLHLRLVAALWPFLDMRVIPGEGYSSLHTVLQRPDLPDSPARAHTLLGCAIMAIEQSAWEKALSCMQESLERFRALGDTSGTACALLQLSHLALRLLDMDHTVPSLPDYAAVRAMLKESLLLCRSLGWIQASSVVLIHLGLMARIEGDMQQSKQLLEEGWDLLDKGDDGRTPTFYLNILNSHATVLYARAGERALLERSLALARKTNRKLRIAAILRVLGVVAMRQGEMAFAISCINEEAQLHREMGNDHALSGALQILGNYCYRLGDYRSACVAYTESLELFRKLGYQVQMAANNLGCTLFHLGEPERARHLHLEALPSYDGGLEGIAWSLERLAVVEAMDGVPSTAARLLGAAAAARRKCGDPMDRWDQDDWDRAIAAVRAELGEPEFERQFETGQDLSWPQAVEPLLHQH